MANEDPRKLYWELYFLNPLICPGACPVSPKSQTAYRKLEDPSKKDGIRSKSIQTSEKSSHRSLVIIPDLDTQPMDSSKAGQGVLCSTGYPVPGRRIWPAYSPTGPNVLS